MTSVNAVNAKSTDFENDTAPFNRRSLTTSYWEQVASFDQLSESYLGGHRVSMSGDGKFLASAPSSSSNNGKSSNGIVRFFQKQESDGTWKEMNDLRLTGDKGGDNFGSGVSLSWNGQRVAIGAGGDNGANDTASLSGSVSVYEKNGDGTAWLLMGQVIHGETYNDQSGFSVALSKDALTLAIGANLSDGNGKLNSGHVRVYRWDAAGPSSFVQMGDDIDGDGANEQSGFSVALSNDGLVVAIGAPSAGSAEGAGNFVGSARVFYWDATNSKWSQRGSQLLSARQFIIILATQLISSEDGKILAVGAGSGKYAKVFQWKDGNEDEDDWEQMGETLTSRAEYFGQSVSLAAPPSSDSTIVAVGSTYTWYTYKLGDDGGWEKLAGGLAGAVVSLSGNGETIAVGFRGPVTVYNLGAITPAPTISSSPSSGPTSGPTLAPSPSGSNGDPHFRTWTGGHFEYHGQCDMILVKDEDFADGLGLEVQIRTKLVKFWSFIQNAAIRIGDDILEMQGSPDLSVNKGNNHYWINSIYQGQVKSLGGFAVKATYAGKHKNKRWFFSKYGGGNKISRSFEIDLSSKYPGQTIVIGSYKEFVRVDFHNAGSDAFGNSVGMLGEFSTGKTLARDGVSELKDYTKLGHEWQVLPQDDGMLFHNVSYPKFPEKCIDPEARAMKRRRRRRLGESSVTDEQAEAACAPIEDALDRKDCVYDVLVTQDLTMVGAY